MTAFSFPRQASVKGNKVAASIVKLAKKLGMSARSWLIRSSFVSHSHICSNQFTMLLSLSLFVLHLKRLFLVLLHPQTVLLPSWFVCAGAGCVLICALAFPCTCTSAVLVQGGCSWHPVFSSTHDGPQGEARTRTQLTSAPVPPIGWEWLVSVRYLHPSCFQWRL